MNKFSKLLLSVFAVLTLTSCSQKEEKKEQESSNQSSQNEKSNNSSQSKKEAFNFTLKDKDGQDVKLSDFKGKKIYINFWASWCKHCINEIQELEETYKELKNKEDIVFLSVTSPSDKEFKNTRPVDKEKSVILNKASDLGVSYPILFDVNDRFVINYRIKSFPTHIFINSDSTINFVTLGELNKNSLKKYINELN